MDHMYLENIEEYVNDQSKIVTYKWLSLTLNVCCNTSKRMLYHFVQNHKVGDVSYPLNVTYLVSGLLYDKDLNADIHRVSVVQDRDLEKTKSEIYNKIFSTHIYSIQKSKLIDLNLLNTVDYDIVRENLTEIPKLSGITCSSAKLREIDASKVSSFIEKKPASAIKEDNNKENKLNSNNVNTNKASNKTSFSANKKDESNSNRGNSNSNRGNSNSNSAKKKDEKQGIAAMFSNQNKTDVSKKNLPKTKKPTPPPTKGGLSSYFKKVDKPVRSEPSITHVKKESNTAGKQESDSKPIVLDDDMFSDEEEKPKSSPSSPAKSQKSPTKSQKSPAKSQKSLAESLKSPVKSQKSSASNSESKSSPKIKNDSKTKKNSSKSKASAKSNSNKRKSKSENPAPKRSRIVVESDSSSDEESDNEEQREEDVEEPLPVAMQANSSDEENEVIPATPQGDGKSVSGRSRRRELVDKTFVDDDGFFVTKKEYVTISDNEEEEKVSTPPVEAKDEMASPTKAEAGKSPKKAKSPFKTKQSSIMSFFKKN